MGENREYVTCAMENGAIHVSEDALASIAAAAITEVEGIHSLSSGLVSKKNGGKKIRVVIAEDGTVSVDCYVVVLYGFSVIDVAKAAQDAVTTVIEAITGGKVSNVNIAVSGISHPRGAKK